tara:strand:+ start:138 stop:479 length:342 start_codon:yes stop_codon:yes gene_type:complete
MNNPVQPNYTPIKSQIFTRNTVYNAYNSYENVLDLEKDIILFVININTYFNTTIICDKFTIRNMPKKTYNKLLILFKTIINFINSDRPINNTPINNDIINISNKINIIFENSF